MKYSLGKKTLTLALFLSFPVLASANENVVRKALQKVVPDASTVDIKKSKLANIYQVSKGLQVFYVTADGKHAITGNVIDLTTGENLTVSTVEKMRKSQYESLDVSSMIVYPAIGKAKRTLAIFSDIDCPYCRKMHAEIPELNEAGIEVRYLAYPRSGVGGKSYWKAVSVWCDKNPGQSMDDAMLMDKTGSKTCDNPVKKHMQLAQKFGVNGTPNIITDRGEMFPGYVPAKDLIKELGL
jgi:thiol:disulfide interchange protein DsbC